MRTNLINRLKEEWNNLDPVDPLRGLIADVIDALTQPASKPWVGLESQDFDGVIKSDAFEAGAYWANNILREKNT